ncbi:MAG TPA: hypothetical protein VMW42_12740 [Desulfatiglandales bacterium]|nr:hypothetical protein [Desulfatiglandales bacterium]
MKHEVCFSGAEAIPLGLSPGLPLAAEADPEGDGNQAKIQPEGLFANIEEIVTELVAECDRE